MSGLTAPATTRLESVDLVRGLAMVLMALDHTRDFLHTSGPLGDPEQLAEPGLALFLTRWVTHFCAPAFVFLAGTGAFLSRSRGMTARQLSRFLVTRGVWLVVLELTLVKFGWTFSFTTPFNTLQVIWVLGVSMIALAALIHLPLGAVLAIGLAVIVGHNALDGVTVQGAWANLWRTLHVPGRLDLGWPPAAGPQFFIRYPLLPWPGVMAVGYCFGALLGREAAARRRVLLVLGGGLIAAFVLLRLANVYGDPGPWAVQPTAAATLIAFLNTQKYPASLLFLLMTLGPVIVLIGLVGTVRGPVARGLVTFGRVPMFFYLVHLPLIHALVYPAALLKYGPEILQRASQSNPPPDWGFGLPTVYGVWIAVVLALYPLCRWYAGVKGRGRGWWLGYV